MFGIASKLGNASTTTNNFGVEFIGSQSLDTSSVTLDTFDIASSDFDGAYYQVVVESANDSTENNYEFATIHVAAQSGAVNHTQYGNVSGNTLATFNVSIGANTVSLTAAGATGGNTVYVYKLGFDTPVTQVDSNVGGLYSLSRTPTNTDYCLLYTSPSPRD